MDLLQLVQLVLVDGLVGLLWSHELLLGLAIRGRGSCRCVCHPAGAKGSLSSVCGGRSSGGRVSLCRDPELRAFNIHHPSMNHVSSAHGQGNFTRPTPRRAPTRLAHSLAYRSQSSCLRLDMADDRRVTGQAKTVPLLLLKTKSAPTDAYEDFFTTLERGRYEPIFVPVLEHKFKQEALDQIRQHLVARRFAGVRPTYGAIIFTSQRAVEAFARIVEELRSEGPELVDACIPKHTPLYAVGPATARGLKSLHLHCPVLGEETGNGQALAAFIVDHYNKLYQHGDKPRLLFLVGDKRRDVIPKTLQSQALPSEQRSLVEELEIYETGEMQSFKSNFTSIWQENRDRGKTRQWVVVFSPTGCQAMLESLGFLDPQTRRVTATHTVQGEIAIATIGPTTRDYLEAEFGFTPDVCAPKPSAEGIAEGIHAFLTSSD